jgi:hypothetical protein
MLRISIALPHRRYSSSWGRATTKRPVPISLAGAEQAVMRRFLYSLAAEGELAKAARPALYAVCSLAGMGMMAPSLRHCKPDLASNGV